MHIAEAIEGALGLVDWLSCRHSRLRFWKLHAESTIEKTVNDIPEGVVDEIILVKWHA